MIDSPSSEIRELSVMSEFVELTPKLSQFPELVQSRRNWIDQVLVPWCRTATRKDLLLAEQAWLDLAGRPEPKQTLWLWAWQRFPVLCEDGLTALNEAWLVKVVRQSGDVIVGFPDARESVQGNLILVDETGKTREPVSIDDIVSVERA